MENGLLQAPSARPTIKKKRCDKLLVWNGYLYLIWLYCSPTVVTAINPEIVTLLYQICSQNITDRKSLWQYGIRSGKFGDLLDPNFISFYVLHDDMKASCQPETCIVENWIYDIAGKFDYEQNIILSLAIGLFWTLNGVIFFIFKLNM